jgi:hypothetical protein
MLMEEFQMNEFEQIWANILKHEGEQFYTVTGKPCSYKISGNQIILLNTNRNIPRSNIEHALAVVNPTVSKLESMNLQGPSYIMAIITDSRIR